MLILTFEEFNNKFNIDNSALSDIRIKDMGKDISLTPIEIVMRDQSPKTIRGPASQIYEPKFNIIVNLHPTDGTHWVSVIRREVGPVYYFDSFVVETPPLSLDEYVDLWSNERKQQYDEFYCGAYCLYMIYLIDRGFRIKSALNILVNQCKYPGTNNECFCLGCNVNQGTDSVRAMPTCFADVNDNDNVNDKDNVNDNDNQGTCFAEDNDKDNDNDSVNDTVNDKDNDNVNFNDHDNVNDNVNDNNNNDNDTDNDNDNVNVKDNDNVNDNVNDKDKDNDNVNDNVNQGTCFGDDNFIYQGTCLASHEQSSFADLFDEKHQKGKPKNNTPTSDISVNINDDLQSWLNDDDIITEAEFSDNFRCIISGPSECGKAFLLKKLILSSIYFDNLHITGSTGDQYQGLERINQIAVIEFVKDMKDLPSPDELPKDLKKLMIFDDVRAKERVINEYICRGRHNNCNMIYLNQNLFSLDRQSVREDCNLFILFEQRGKVLASIYQDFFNNIELSYNDFANICNKVWKEPYNYIVIDITKNKNINGKLKINWDRRVL